MEPCGSTGLRLGAEAADLAAMNRAVAEFLGPGSDGPFSFDGLLAQGTKAAMLKGPEVTLGLCAPVWRVAAHLRPIAADMPEGIGIFTDPARLRGLSRGILVEARGGRDFGRLQVGLGLGIEADWTRLHLSSDFIELKSRDFALVVPLTLRVDWRVGQGAVGFWLRKSWSRHARGMALGLALTQRF